MLELKERALQNLLKAAGSTVSCLKELHGTSLRDILRTRRAKIYTTRSPTSRSTLSAHQPRNKARELRAETLLTTRACIRARCTNTQYAEICTSSPSSTS